MSGVNVHDPQYREAKPAQGNASIAVADLFRLDNRTVLITGASGFLGVEVAVSVLESGGDVVGLDVSKAPRPANSERIVTIAKKHSRNWSYYQCDVTDSEAVTAVFARLTPSLRYPLRGLVACAGVSDNGPAIEFPVSSFRRLLDINVAGMFAVAQAAARNMKDSNVSGSMVLVASMSGHVSNKASGCYTSKSCATVVSPN